MTLSVILSEASQHHRDAQSKDPEGLYRTTASRTFLPRICLSLVLAMLPAFQAQAQGCAQCLDATQSTPPSVQAGYRHAIYLLGGAGATFFIAGLIVFRRNP